MVLGETTSPSGSTAKTKHASSSSHRSSASSTAQAGTNLTAQNSTAAASATSASMDQNGSGVVKGKNVCVVEPQSTSKATAVVAPLMAESRQFTELFGQPIVKSDAAPKKHHQHKVR